MGYRQRVVTIPDMLLSGAGRVMEVWRDMGGSTEVNLVNMRQLMVREYYDNSRGIR